ncbi:probable aldo-keto reductase 1, partial [Camellia sinensis]|uniref:probable aldo-keto reductase 1 n=1 Tax=Camellia sinensis TaxID=4442 RepID=UPI001035C11A
MAMRGSNEGGGGGGGNDGLTRDFLRLRTISHRGFPNMAGLDHMIVVMTNMGPNPPSCKKKKNCGHAKANLVSEKHTKLGYGCMGLTSMYNSLVPKEDGIAIIKYAFSKGITFIDTLDIYEADNANEILVGKQSHPRFTRQNLEHNRIFYLRIKELAKKHSCTPVQLALAWILHQRDDMVPIPGTTKIKNLDENIGAVRVKLTEDDLKEISDAVSMFDVAGPRMFEKDHH